ncbi:MAG: response regulator [Paraburkholderia sp.]|nr:response regulator [Paraburkholderia sp.]
MIEHGNTVIHVVDDDASMRVALRRLLHGAGYEVRDYASAGEYLVSEPDARSGCILLDLELGGPSGLELQQALLRHPRALPVVFMSAYSDVPRTVKAMKAGAVDFLLKPFDRRALFDALDAALSAPANDALQHAEKPSVDLGERERAVLRGIVAGQRNKQIAAQLGLSERTIKSCRAGLMHKFEATSLAELLRRAESLVSMPLMQ